MNVPRRRSWLRSTSVLLVLAAGLALTLASFAFGFPDVPQSYPYADAIADLSSRGVIDGFADGTFGPARPVMRQQFAKMVVLTAGLTVSEEDVCPFSDVDLGGPTTFYPDNFVAVAAAHGITTGMNATTFSPFAEISRAQVVSMVVRAVGGLHSELLTVPPATYESTWDPSFSTVHGENCRIAEYNGLLAGLPLDELDPWGPMPRGEVAQVLHDYLVLTGASSTTTTGGATSTAGATTSTTLTDLPTGDLLLFRRAGSGSWTSVDLSERMAGQQIADTITTWAEYDSSAGRSWGRIAAMSPVGDLLVFSEQKDSGWGLENVTRQTGQSIAGPVTDYVGRLGEGPQTVHLFAQDPSNDLIHFSQNGAGAWTIENVSAATGVKISGKIDTKSERFAAMTPAGDVVYLHRSSDSWEVENLSAITGEKATAPPTAWRNVGVVGPTITYVAFRNLQGKLTVLWTMPVPREWRVMTSHRSIEGTPFGKTGWYAGSGYVSQLACVDPRGQLVFMWARHDDSLELSSWETQTPSALLNQEVAGPPLARSLYVGWENGVGWEEEVQAASPTGQLVTFRSSSPVKWRLQKTSPPSGLKVVGWQDHWYEKSALVSDETILVTAALGVR